MRQFSIAAPQELDMLKVATLQSRALDAFLVRGFCFLGLPSGGVGVDEVEEALTGDQPRGL